MTTIATAGTVPTAAGTPATLSVRVTAADSPAPGIRRLRLAAEDGGALPPFTAGAHVQLLTGEGRWRSYSLVRLDVRPDPAPREYVLAVRLEPEGRGGSRFVHEGIAVGDVLTIRAPTNHFALDPEPTTILLAGGIGITPIASMAAELQAADRPYVLHYSGRSLGAMAFVDALRALAGERLVLHADDDPASRLSIDALLAGATPRQPIYVCGPAGMIDAVRAAAAKAGWPADGVRFELFTEVTPQAGDVPFEVELARSGRTVTVPSDRSLLDVLTDAGCDVMHDCRAGYCGLCSTAVVSGEIDHRDTYLSDADKAGGRAMQVCVSRGRGRVVLDL